MDYESKRQRRRRRSILELFLPPRFVGLSFASFPNYTARIGAPFIVVHHRQTDSPRPQTLALQVPNPLRGELNDDDGASSSFRSLSLVCWRRVGKFQQVCPKRRRMRSSVWLDGMQIKSQSPFGEKGGSREWMNLAEFMDDRKWRPHLERFRR